MKDTFKYSLVLFLICFTAGILLSSVYAITQPLIQKTRLQAVTLALKQVLPEAKETQKIEKGDLVYYLALDEKSKAIGYIFSCEANGYASIIRAMVSADTTGKIKAIIILEQNETPGIGSKITEESFLQGFKHRTKQDAFDTITGATISSGALVKSIKQNLEKIFP